MKPHRLPQRQDVNRNPFAPGGGIVMRRDADHWVAPLYEGALRSVPPRRNSIAIIPSPVRALHRRHTAIQVHRFTHAAISFPSQDAMKWCGRPEGGGPYTGCTGPISAGSPVTANLYGPLRGRR